MYSFRRRRIPAGICVLFAADIALVVAPTLDYLVGSPFSAVRNWLSLDSEFSLPAWYSSMQWFCAAMLFGLIPAYLWKRRLPGMWALAALALLCLVFSIDEILGIHEWLGRQSDALLPHGHRDHTLFSRTGIWPIVIGLPVVAILAALLLSLKRVYTRSGKHACRRLVAGVIVMFSGALLVELANNFMETAVAGGGLALLQVVVEEFLEMVGVTVIIWAAYDFTVAHGFALSVPSGAIAEHGAGRTAGKSTRSRLEPVTR